jgi:hypothetical protein
MLRNPKFLKAVAAFLILETLFNTVAPTISWALTAGPTAPEFSSFEPADTTDMVNLLTGDMVHNIPLLEVPGPSGGYPLSLSYHAGIKLDQEASWVGLGWTLNPGAITRSVSGFADDDKNVRREVRDFWDGGESTTKTYTVGLSIPKTGIGLNYSIAQTHDTYKGFSSQSAYGASFTYANKAGFNYGTISVGNNGVHYDATGLVSNYLGDAASNLQQAGIKSEIGMDISTKGVKAHAKLSMAKMPVSNSGGINTVSQTLQNSAVGCKFGSFAIQKQYTRYWSDQSDALYSYGTLYSAEGSTKADHYEYYDNNEDINRDEASLQFISYSNDVHELPRSNSASTQDAYDQANAAYQLGGAFPSNDVYSVTAQGVSGSIEPFIFDNGNMKGQNTYARDRLAGNPYHARPSLEYRKLKNFSSNKVDFRFRNDFSNSLTVDNEDIETSILWTLDQQTVQADPYGYNGNDESTSDQKLVGSKDIQWFTNEEIAEGSARSAGFIDCYSSAGQRMLETEIYDDYLQPEACAPFKNGSNVRGLGESGDAIYLGDYYPKQSSDVVDPGYAYGYNSLKPKIVSLEDKIGGFMITNESGVTYHYALPVYAYNEYTRTRLKEPVKEAATIKEIKNNEPYAYTWLLTAITGPDYVDRGGQDDGPNHILDDDDFGYWVKFDYGLWSDSYQWRTPFTGYANDIESKYETFSYGIKELYYLDAIETKSHKAFFVKSKRQDGRGVTSRLEGGSEPRSFYMRYLWSVDHTRAERAHLKYAVSPVSTMKLDAIYLFDKKDLEGMNVVKNSGDRYDNFPISSPKTYPYEGSQYVYDFPPVTVYDAQGNIVRTINDRQTVIKQGNDFVKVKYHNGDLVLDDEDIKALPASFEANTLRKIVFNTDYSLARKVPNSMGFFSNRNVPCITGTGLCTPEEAQQNGELNFEWPATFQCDNGSSFVVRNPKCCDHSNGTHTGDADRFYSDDPLYDYTYLDCWVTKERYDFLGGYIAAINGKSIKYNLTGKLTLKEVKILGKGGADMMPPTKFAYSKNPEYIEGKFDSWGYYKKDFEELVVIDGTGGTPDQPWMIKVDGRTIYDGPREITSTSATDVSAWSLTSFTTPLGKKVDIVYEPNTYSKSVYNKDNVLGLRLIQNGSGNYCYLYFNQRLLDIPKHFPLGSTVRVNALIVGKVAGEMKPVDDIFVGNLVVESIGSDYIRVRSDALHSLLVSGRNKVVDGHNETIWPYFIAGAAIIPGSDATTKYAGGIRVKSVTSNEFGGHTNTVEYDYNQPGTTLSSGVTSFVPYEAISVNYPTGDDDDDFFDPIMSKKEFQEQKRTLVQFAAKFQKVVSTTYENAQAFVREAPAPGAFYEYVTVRTKYDNISTDVYLQHRFKVFDSNMITRTERTYGSGKLYEVNIQNNSIDVGQILGTKVFSKDNILLSETKYGYLHDENIEAFETPLLEKKQGVVEQAFHKYIAINEWNTWDHSQPTLSYSERKAMVSKRTDRSNVVTSVEQHDYRNNVTSKTRNITFDFYTGQATGVISTDASGASYLSEVLPAYRIDKYSGDGKDPFGQWIRGMGLKLRNPYNKHMLSQQAAAYSYRLGLDDAKIGLVSGSVQTWSDQIGVIGDGVKREELPPNYLPRRGYWRKSSELSFVGVDGADLTPEGYYKLENVPYFDAWTESPSGSQDVPDGWQLNSRVTLYDVYSHALEAKDMNGHYGATRMASDNVHVLASVVNGRYKEFAYWGEEHSNPDGTFENSSMKLYASRVDTNPHTGLSSLQVAASGKAISYTFLPEKSKSYTISVWSKSPNVQFGSNRGFAFTKTVLGQAGEWYLVEATFTTPGTAPLTAEVWVEAGSTTTYVDDFRVFPTDAAMVSYVYNQFGELSYILDGNNLFTQYDYDAMGRLITVSKETFSHGTVITTQQEYKYAGQQ